MRWLAFLCYTAILVDGLFILMVIGNGGLLWGAVIWVPAGLLLAALILLARWIVQRERPENR